MTLDISDSRRKWLEERGVVLRPVPTGKENVPSTMKSRSRKRNTSGVCGVGGTATIKSTLLKRRLRIKLEIHLYIFGILITTHTILLYSLTQSRMCVYLIIVDRQAGTAIIRLQYRAGPRRLLWVSFFGFSTGQPSYSTAATTTKTVS